MKSCSEQRFYEESTAEITTLTYQCQNM